MLRSIFGVGWLIPVAAAFTLDSAVEQFTDSLLSQLNQLSLTSKEVIREAEDRMADAPYLCQGRLTLESGVPISTSGIANASTLYFTPFQGSRVALYTGTVWNIHSFTERSLALSGLTADTNYDVFLYNNAGTLTLELTAWTDDTTRATGLSLQDSVYVRTGARTRRYLGTIRATSATQTQDTPSQRFLWNHYHRVRKTLEVSEGTNSWNYLTAAFRQVNGTLANRIEYIAGLNEVTVYLRGMELIGSSGVDTTVATSFGLDTSGVSITNTLRGGGTRSTIRQQVWSTSLENNNGIGYTSYYWVEQGSPGLTIYGDDNDPRVQSGVIGWLEG